MVELIKRNTIQRKLVLNAVIDAANHPTADTIYHHIREEYPDISLGTVYRNLTLLWESGQIKKICVPNAADRFDRTIAPHYHILCTQCGSFSDVETPYIDELDNKIEKDTGYQVEEHDIIFTGICPDCQKSKVDQ